MLYPFWGKNPENIQEPEAGRFNHYIKIGSSFFEMTSLKRADSAHAEVKHTPTEWRSRSNYSYILANG